MRENLESKIERFNALASRYQDDAYTFAYYLLGDERCAARATGAAFARVSRRRLLGVEEFRAALLREVLQCRAAGGIPVSGQVGQDELASSLQRLCAEERSALVLVDVLNCSYAEAAHVLNCSTRQVLRLLARGRLDLSRTRLAM